MERRRALRRLACVLSLYLLVTFSRPASATPPGAVALKSASSHSLRSTTACSRANACARSSRRWSRRASSDRSTSGWPACCSSRCARSGSQWRRPLACRGRPARAVVDAAGLWRMADAPERRDHRHPRSGRPASGEWGWSGGCAASGASGPDTFKAVGPYRWVRHPIYSGWLLLVFATSPMTATRFLFAVVSSAYLLLAIPLEERSLRATTGGAYERYMRRSGGSWCRECIEVRQ